LADNPTATNRVYTIDPDQSGPNAPVDTYCDMTNPIHGGGWTQLYDQDVTVMDGYLPKATWRDGVTNTAPNEGQFSILQMTSYFSQAGEWEFLLDWDDRTTFVRWTQTEDPFVGRGTVNVILESPTGQSGGTGDSFGGLLAPGDGSATLDGDPSMSNRWWWAVGTSAPWLGGVPAYKGSDAGPLVAQRPRLWVR
jgi:hypothetical protein